MWAGGGLARGRAAAGWRGPMLAAGVLLLCAHAQESDVLLPQGRIIGIKVYPENSATPVEIFLGIPYAAPPIGRLRFSAPARHPGWNRTLFAHKPAPRCPQPAAPRARAAPASAPAAARSRESEDCLYLNVWAPQRAGRGRLPVVVLLHSESWATAAPVELPGERAAADGVLLVQPAYRLNALGFLTLGSAAARGNLGLLDQYLALLWVRDNIEHFGGDPNAVTLLGHSAGAVSVLYHLVSPRTRGLFQRAIIMSPTELMRTLGDRSGEEDAAEATHASRSLATLLRCDEDADHHAIVRCLQARSTDSLMAAYTSLQSSGNWSELRPVCDGFLPAHAQYVPLPLASALLDNDRLPTQVPLLFGITDLEAIDSNEEWWRELATRGAAGVLHLATYSAIPELLRLHQLDSPHTLHLLTEAVRWEYWGTTGEPDGWHAAERLARAESAARSGAGAALLAARLARLALPSPLYVYRYTQQGGIDLRGNELNHTGAAHGAELVPALGASLLHALVRRRATADEQRLERKMRFLFNFAKLGSPVAGTRDAWPAYRPGAAHVQRVSLREESADLDDDAAFWLRYLPRLANVSAAAPDPAQFLQPAVAEGSGRLRGAVYALASVAGALAALLAASAVLLGRAARARAAA